MKYTLSQFLEKLGYSKGSKLQFCAWNKENYKLNRRTSLTIHSSIIPILKKWNNVGGGVNTTSVGFVPNNSRYDNEVVKSSILFAEFDDNTTLEQQLNRLKCIGMPHPTIMMSTGNKSVHYYWKLTEEIDISKWQQLMKDIAYSSGSDIAVTNPARVMRLPFFIHPKSGKAAEIIELNDNTYTYEEIRSKVKSVVREEKIVEIKGGQTTGQKGNKNGWILDFTNALLGNYDGVIRNGKLTSRCPNHKGESKSVFYVNLSTGSYCCHAGCSSKDIYHALNN